MDNRLDRDKENEENLVLLDRWHDSKDPRYFQKLYVRMKPDIEKAMKGASYGSNLPPAAHKAWGAQIFHDALNTFDASRGVKLSTHVYGAVQNKSKRLNYRFGNLGYVPEPRAAQIGLYQNEFENLKDQLGRDPTAHELADRLGMGVKDVTHIQKEVMKDLALAEGTEEKVTFESPHEEEVLKNLYFSLAPEEQGVYDLVFGEHGRPRMVKPNGKIDYDGIGRRLGFSSSKVRTLAKSISGKFKREVER